ncbi:6-phosphogluconate dehydrogenase C-terminal domain-like protein [Pleomassaria siparia CBS 279.74]|uniref:6-phosphogluconate dehydrogenase C-terminal domain-like protein n=1 Tax=Pleomassaria siparia CBS 279.74 TaxID=1314801 RepID=A0A6G1JTH8_9PLEO|nr:6-phosphogluconate dehydrogenase C-terminal domain-like protein [Pleomassaria siparia CBS 279.74]
MASPLATIGVLSIGQMGLGIAKLLVAHNYTVLTNVANRSQATQERAQKAQLGLVNTDVELVARCDYILSIVPPRDAVATAARVIDALNSTPLPRPSSSSPLYYLDLNAISPSTMTSIAEAFAQSPQKAMVIDGGIIGGPPSPIANSASWTCPGVPLSGPHPLHDAPLSGAHLASTLNTNHVGPTIGSASGLKCCFAALAKGMTALALQSFSTAASLNVLPHLHSYLKMYNPRGGEAAERGILGCPQKAYRWVEEMNQIGDCFAENGGWAEQASVFRQIAGVYEELAQVVEKRGGTDGMENLGGTLGALQEGLEGGKKKSVGMEELEQEDR